MGIFELYEALPLSRGSKGSKGNNYCVGAVRGHY